MKVMETSDEFIVQRTGVRRRRHAPPEMAASDLAALACRDAVADAGLTHGPDRHADHEHHHPRSCRSRLRVLPASQAGPGRHARARHQAAMRGLDLRAVAGRPLRSRRHLPPRAGRLQREALHADRRLQRGPQHRGPPGRRGRGGRGRALARRPARASSPPSSTPTAGTPRPSTPPRPGSALGRTEHVTARGHRSRPRPLPHGRQGRLPERRREDVRRGRSSAWRPTA